jgi:hypothetical protein
MPRKATKKKWQRPILRIHRKSEDERRRLERAGLSSLPCTNPANTPGRCYKRPASSPSKN